MGKDTTKELIRQNFWWPGMNDKIVNYIQSCPECQLNKASKYKSYGLLQPLELAYSPWSSIATAFITDLLLSDGYNRFWVIIDSYTKWGILYHSRKMKNTQGILH
jgi:putative transposase